jgi:malonate transporter MadL subunit
MGKFLGTLLGRAINIDGDVGGVGIAMILLMVCGLYLRKTKLLPPESERGIWFWSSIYIPVVVAMAATQNVKAAFSGGWVAILAGVGVIIVSFILVPMISKIGRNTQEGPDES